MIRKPVSDAELAKLGEFHGMIERNSNFRQQAFDHNLGRNVRVVKLLSYLALMRQAGISLAGNVDCVAAGKQNFSSSKTMTLMGLPTGPMQAAHFLPGQLTIGCVEVWQFAKNPTTRGHIEFLFAEVEHLPLAFNQADTAAEANGRATGLCAALAHACSVLIGQPLTANPRAGKAPVDLIQVGYNDWQRNAITALRTAIASKEAKPGIPPLEGDRFEGYTAESITARSTASSKLWNRDEALRVLEYYLEDQQQRTSNWIGSKCQGTLWEVESNFKG